MGNFSGEETRVSRRFSGGLSASRVTPTWKQNYGGFVNYSYRKNTFTDRDDLEFINTDWNFNTTVVYSVAQYWSLGFTSRIERNTRQNQDLAVQFNPALEYSVFPYDEATRRSLTAFYEIGPVHFNYNKETVFELFKETRFQEALTLEFSQRQTWGDVSINVKGSHYLHDFNRNNLDLGGNVSFRITCGLDLRFGGNYTLVADQLYLALEDLTPDEILTGVQAGCYGQRVQLLCRIVLPVRLDLQQCREQSVPGWWRRVRRSWRWWWWRWRW